MSVEMKITGLMIDPVSNMPIIILKNQGGDAVLPIWVGIFEANAIAMQMENIESPRPMTHDLLGDLITSLGSKLEQIVISDLKDHTFYATLVIRQNGQLIEVDARPSDAIALGVAGRTPIFAENHVLDEASRSV